MKTVYLLCTCIFLISIKVFILCYYFESIGLAILGLLFGGTWIFLGIYFDNLERIKRAFKLGEYY